MDAQCNEEMILKFGRLVDLEALEQVTVNRQVEELKEKLRVTEIECSTDLKRWEVCHLVIIIDSVSCSCPCFHVYFVIVDQEKIRKKKDRITELIRENTNRIETLNMMQSEKRDLQTQLDSKQKRLVC